jgi:DegV family protein with EDD domain
MANFTLFTDSASDVSDVQQKEWGIKVIELKYLLDGTLYSNKLDHSEYPIKDFYAALRNGSACSTSAANMGDFIDAFTPELEKGNDVFYIAFSSGLSATYQNALNAISELKEQFPDRKIVAIDSLCASFGQGLFVYLCSEKKKAGMSFDELLTYAEELKHRICHEFTVDDLGQLKRGGRISPTAALFGSMLQIKPMLFVTKEGKLAPYEKVRGRRIALKKLADMLCGEANTDNTPIFISHGDCEDEVNEVIELIKQKLPNKKFVTNYVGPVIGAHSGYKTVAIFCVGDNRGDARLKD